ncbi:MAG: hypothetical protein ACLVKO_02740 [Dysgonomonas sp.]
MNKKTKETIYQISALLILLAAVLWLFSPETARFVMIVGVVGFTITTFKTPYPGKSIRGKRLFNIQVFAVLLMIVSACLMFFYIKEWVIPLFISGILTLYCAILLPRTYEKEKEEGNEK